MNFLGVLPARWVKKANTKAKTAATVHEEEIDLQEVDVAGNTKRSDGELVGQFISSCRLSVVFFPTPETPKREKQNGTTHTHRKIEINFTATTLDDNQIQEEVGTEKIGRTLVRSQGGKGSDFFLFFLQMADK